MEMRFCQLLLLSAMALGCLAEVPTSTQPHAHDSIKLRGKLRQREGQQPALETSEHKLVTLEGDEAALKVLNDKRLDGAELEATGHFTATDRFRVDPNHARTVLAHKDGKLKMITYWCDTCSIRSYEPGPCWCCQAETVLELRDPDAQ
jgi:hypothetical protein